MESIFSKNTMGFYRIFFTLLAFSSLMNTLFMINTYRNGWKAMGQIPAQLLFLGIGIISVIVILIMGVRYHFETVAVKEKRGWKRSNSILFFLSMGLVVYNVLIMWYLAR